MVFGLFKLIVIHSLIMATLASRIQKLTDDGYFVAKLLNNVSHISLKCNKFRPPLAHA